jgi:hypothetical protein
MIGPQIVRTPKDWSAPLSTGFDTSALDRLAQLRPRPLANGVRRGNIMRSDGGYLRRGAPKRTERDKPLAEFDHGDK